MLLLFVIVETVVAAFEMKNDPPELQTVGERFDLSAALEGIGT